MTFFRDGLALPVWFEVRDGHPLARAIYRRHYSCRNYKDGRLPKNILGPGEYILLLTAEADAIFAWRKFIDDAIPKQTGVNCSIFRNEAQEKYKSSELILIAEVFAQRKWPGERMYTYVSETKTRHKRDPGRCFRKAGWIPCGHTKGGLLILEKLP